MLQDLIQVGCKVELRQLDNGANPIKSASTYVSQVVDYIDDDTMCIAAPIKNGMVVLFDRGAAYRLSFFTAKRGLYQCNGYIYNIYKEKNMTIMSVKLTSKLEKVQRRNYFRVECVHEIEYRRVTEEEIRLARKLMYDNSLNEQEKNEITNRLEQLNSVWNKGCTKDISGGGCKLNSMEKLERGDRILIKFYYEYKNQLKKLNLAANIIASEKLDNRSGQYEHRVEFYNVSPKDRDDLIKFIFEQERISRKNKKKYR